ncbi:MAG: RluA family pseudouridine synthase [Sphaerochaeta sp.]|jgi:23S rRNA pseudouridine1911/1915/1917 synthase|nr:RluA family pseudouridine synthase [Sphaerochaeta sp.]PKL29602.1 MAG: RluA family pseudouridine synthase [Spirochaetae bacterium HGW-Spirochaetae-2]
MASITHELNGIVPHGTVPSRIDSWISLQYESFPRSAASDSRTIFTIDGKIVKKSKMVKGGNTIRVTWVEDVFDQIVGQDIPLQILYEDSHLLVIDKPQSLVVHPGAGNPNNTVVNALVYRYGENFFSTTQASDDDVEEDDPAGTAQPLRPGIVHRLDKETSGVMVVALDRGSHTHVASQFKERTTEKYYIAIVCGYFPKRRGHIETTIVRDPRDRKKFCVGKEQEGKVAKTDYLVLRQFHNFALVRLRLLTGRTHQLRVHMKHIGCPILGDPVYGKTNALFPDVSMMLHALCLELEHPVTARRMRFTAPMPNRFKVVLRSLLRKR